VKSEDRSGIFEPFVTSKAEGSGLGLAISLRIVEEHGGSLELKESDQGAVFEARLPLG
jgi:signal transduction histidine kinase